MQATGQLIKKIRLNKGLSQSNLTRGNITQSAYSYFEKENRHINYVAFIDILDNLGLTVEEFRFIQNNYDYIGLEKLIQKFFSLKYNNVEQLEEIIKEFDLFLETEANSNIYNYREISKALLILMNTGDILKAREIVTPIWDYLSNLNQFYLKDVMMINTIIFVFELETAIEIVKTIEKRVLEYKDFSSVKELIVAVNLNLIAILLSENQYEQAYEIITTKIFHYKRELKYSLLLVVLNKKSICEYKLKKFTELKETRETIKNVTNLFNDSQFFIELEKEYHHFN